VLNWLRNDKGFQLDGRHIDVKAKAVHARGDFRYLQPVGDEPWLGILAGISTDDGSQAWRYFPENLMGKALVDYLSGARKTVSYGILASCISTVSLPFSTLPSSLPLKCSAPGSSFHCFQARSFHVAWKRVFSVA